jgi:hypothetical protein
LKLAAPQRQTMIVMTFTVELDIGLTYLLQSALPLLVTDRETTLIVVGGPIVRPFPAPH